MLNFILGRSGTERNEQLMQRIQLLSGKQEKCILMTPEQASFEYEKAIALNDKLDNSYIEVVNFTRLAKLCFNTLGGSTKELLNKTGSFLMMSMALEEIKDELVVYSRNHQSYGFINSMLSIYDECHNAGITAEKLSTFSFQQDKSLLKEKTLELSLIFDCYNAIVSQGHADSNDILDIASDKLSGSDYFKGYNIFFDGFTGFSASQYKIIECMLKDAKDVYFSLVLDAVDRKNQVFEVANLTRAKLEKIAVDYRIPLGKVSLIQKPTKYASEQIKQLEHHCAGYEIETPINENKIKFYSAQNRYDEIEWVCSNILKLVREENYRYKDIVVIPRTLDKYSSCIEQIFKKYNISFYMDSIKDVRSQTIVKWILLASSIASKGCDTELMLEFLKSPMMRVSTSTIAEIENYCYIWSIKGGDWKHEFKNHPDGLVEGFDDNAKIRLGKIESCRKKLIRTLSLFIFGKISSGREFAKALYNLFLSEETPKRYIIKKKNNLKRVFHSNKLKISTTKNILKSPRENLFSYIRSLVKNNCMSIIQSRVFLEEQSMLWGEICKVLDLFEQILGDIPTNPKKLSELLELSIGTLELTSVPHTLDQVMIGTADRIRTNNPKVVFVIGAVEGEYPLVSSPQGVLSDNDRKKLLDSGVEILGDSDELESKERMFCYQAISCASDKVFLSYPKNHSGEKGIIPSSIYLIPFSIWGKADNVDNNEIDRIVNLKTALSFFALQKEQKQKQTLEQLIVEIDGYDVIKHIKSSSSKKTHQINDGKVPRSLFGTNIKISPTRIDRYNSCPFSYFVNFGLKARPRMKAQLNPLQSGSLIHMALETIVSKYGGKNLEKIDETELRTLINKIIQDYLIQRLGDEESLSYRDRYLFMRLSESIYILIRRLGFEFSQSIFEPEFFELNISNTGQLSPMLLKTQDGIQISVYGTIDRVDTAIINGQKYVRVIDYKSTGKKFKLSDIFYGLNMQMLVYLFSIWHGGKNKLENTLPAGILYMPNISKFHSVERKDDGSKLEDQINKHYKMNGLILDDPDVVKAMDINSTGIFIPQRTPRNVESFIGLEDIGKLCTKIEKQIELMACRLTGGNVQAKPTISKTTSPCEFCDYSHICGFEDGDPVINQNDVSRRIILEGGYNENEQY